MNKHTVLDTRILAISALATGMLFLAGCMTKPIRPVNSDGTYCHRIGKSYRPKLTCTTEPVPSLDVEAQVKRFEVIPDALTVYVLRHRWGDTANRVAVAVDGHSPIITIPMSLLRLRLKPGEHHLALAWEGRMVYRTITGAAGETRFVELAGSVWSWGSTYGWKDDSSEMAQMRAAASAKLIADVDLR